MALTLTKITNAIKQPIRKVFQGDLRTLFVDNPAAIVLWTYGSRIIAGVRPGHDHADDGGELLKGTLFRVSYGPYLREGAGVSSFQRGIPLLRGPFDPPKLLAPSIVTLPGGLARVRGALVVFTGSVVGSTTLNVVLRSIGLHNMKASASATHASVVTDLTWNAAGGYSVLEWSWSGRALAKAKGTKNRARCEFAVYQTGSGFGATGGSVVSAELWVDDDPEYIVRPPAPSDPSASEVTFFDIKAGKLLVTTLSQKLRGAWNALTQGVLGRAPGLTVDSVTIDRLREWRQRIKGAHRHYGRLVPSSSGGFYSDGPCLTYPPKASACLARFWGEDASALKNAAGTQAQGKKLHSSGALDETWLYWDNSIDLESGLGALDVSCAVEPGNVSDSARLYLHVGIFREGDVGGTNLVKAVRCSYHQQEATDAEGLFVCELEPEENEPWQPNVSRRAAGKSVYSHLAAKLSAQTSPLFETTNAYRVSQVAKVEISHPAYQPDGVARPTGRYVLRLRFSLQQSLGVYDDDARILGYEAIAAKGY